MYFDLKPMEESDMWLAYSRVIILFSVITPTPYFLLKHSLNTCWSQQKVPFYLKEVEVEIELNMLNSFVQSLI